MRRKIHVCGPEDTGAVIDAAHFGSVSVSPEIAERLGAFRETALEEEDIDPAFEVDRMLEEEWMHEEQEAAHLPHRRKIDESGTPD